MGGNSSEDDWNFHSLSNGARTILLVGRTGNGKSATGNSIIGRNAFNSDARFTGVTSTTEMQSTMLKNGQVINVIDTIGLFDSCVGSEVIGKEIVKCIDLAKDGIHAIVLVLSVRTRFTNEEATSLQILQNLFGPKTSEYLIVLFTGGDELEVGETLDDYLGRGCPEQLKSIFNVCNNRRVLFDNKSKDGAVITNQRQNLLSLVEKVMVKNGGRPYTDSIFKEIKKETMKLRQQEIDAESQGYTQQELSKLKEQMLASHNEQLERITNQVVSKLREITKLLEDQLAEEKAARQRGEERARAAQEKSNEEIHQLRGQLERKTKEHEDEIRKLRANEEFHQIAQIGSMIGKCITL